MIAFAVEYFATQYEVARRPGVGAARPGKPSRDRPANGCAVTEMRRLKRKHLPSLQHRLFDFCERRARADDDHELARLVFHDARVSTRVDHVTRRLRR